MFHWVQGLRDFCQSHLINVCYDNDYILTPASLTPFGLQSKKKNQLSAAWKEHCLDFSSSVNCLCEAASHIVSVYLSLSICKMSNTNPTIRSSSPSLPFDLLPWQLSQEPKPCTFSSSQPPAPVTAFQTDLQRSWFWAWVEDSNFAILS